MSKAEATTGLAPKNASVIDPLGAASRSPQRVLFLISPVSLVKSLRS
jgi:hypothetical protein